MSPSKVRTQRVHQRWPPSVRSSSRTTMTEHAPFPQNGYSSYNYRHLLIHMFIQFATIVISLHASHELRNRSPTTVTAWSTAPTLCHKGTSFGGSVTVSPIAHRRHIHHSRRQLRRHDGGMKPPLADHREDDLERTSTTAASSTVGVWNPQLRAVMGVMASLGMLETAYLTWHKILVSGASSMASPASSAPLLFCSLDRGDCDAVLNGPYSDIPGTHIPLAALGWVAYATTAYLALMPWWREQQRQRRDPRQVTTPPLLPSASSVLLDRANQPIDDTGNRILLASLVTTMGVFSVFLMSLLFGVLHQSCPYCLISAILSITLANIAWLGGVVPANMIKTGIVCSTTGGFAALLSAVIIFASVDNDVANGMSLLSSTTNVVASSTSTFVGMSTVPVDEEGIKNRPPSTSTTSSPQALQLTLQLSALNAKMYGAYWCSHCFEQKQSLGKEAMMQIPYIECSKDGANSQSAQCRERQVPGYPTWEINGTLYPGEQALDELAEIIAKEQGKLSARSKETSIP